VRHGSGLSRTGEIYTDSSKPFTECRCRCAPRATEPFCVSSYPFYIQLFWADESGANKNCCCNQIWFGPNSNRRSRQQLLQADAPTEPFPASSYLIYIHPFLVIQKRGGKQPPLGPMARARVEQAFPAVISSI
jgi:hypothetical protein